MKHLISIFCVLVLASAVWAKRNPYYDNWLTPERLERWQDLSQNMDANDLYTLIEEMYYLPKEPWPESTKSILLKMTQLHRQRRLDQQAGNPIIIPDIVMNSDGEIDALLDEMVSWQNDPRFIEFQKDYPGQGLSARGLAKIGEPAFDVVLKKLKEYHPYSIWTVRLWMQNKDSFLHQNRLKLSTVRSVLIQSAKPPIEGERKDSRGLAIAALRYFPDPEVFTLLKQISLTDTQLIGGKYLLRTGAQESLEYMRNH